MTHALVLVGFIAAPENDDAVSVDLSADVGFIAITFFIFVLIVLAVIFGGRSAGPHRPFRGRYVYHGRDRRGTPRRNDLSGDDSRFGGGGASGSW